MTITAAGRKYSLCSFTGKVTGKGKDFMIYWLGQGNKTNMAERAQWLPLIKIETTGSGFHHVFLRADDGSEHSFSPEGWDIVFKEGHELTVVWAVRKGRERGSYIIIRNNTTRQVYFSRSVEKIFKVPLFIQAIFIALFSFTAWLFTNKTIAIFIGFVTGLPVVLITSLIISRIRSTKFKTSFRINPRRIENQEPVDEYPG